jgi:hypothetical protein
MGGFMLNKLVDDIKVIRDMTDYNFGNILKGIDSKWLSNRHNLIKDNKTILGIYFNHPLIRKNLEMVGYNPGILKLSIEQYIKLYKPHLSKPDDCCVYFRLGDVLFNRADDSLSYNYIEQIGERQHKNIVIVCCISFCGNAPDETQWVYTDEKLEYNKQKISEVIDNIENTFPDSQVRIQSSINPDHDICFLYGTDFIANVRTTWRKILVNL